jgi:hypothetical protein
MNKKTVTLIAAIFCCFIIILVSYIGAVSEDEYIIKVNKLEFTDISRVDGVCQKNEDGEKIIYIERGTTEYQLTYLLDPIDATDLDIKFTLISVDESLAEIDHETGLITFHKEVAVTAKITNMVGANQSDFVTIEFTGNIVNEETGEPW